MASFPLNFTPAELEVNRQGRVSEAQRKVLDDYLKTLHGAPRLTRHLTRLGLVVFSLLLIGMSLVNEYDRVGRDISKVLTPSLLAALGVLSVIAVIGMMLPWVMDRIAERPLVKGQIYRAAGRAKISRHVYPSPNEHYSVYQVSLVWAVVFYKTFHFPDEASLRYFQENERYRIYYVPYGPMEYVLSVEKLDDHT